LRALRRTARETAGPRVAPSGRVIELQFLGAAGTVTGSMHLLRTSRASVLLDCGLYQGHRHESFERNRKLPVDAASLDAAVLSHAHIDHSGALPSLQKNGLRGPIWATPATRDLCAVMLADAATLQESDARYINRAIERGQVDLEPVEPIYTIDDVTATMERMAALPYHRPQAIAPGVTLTLFDAGHVLGSALVVLDVEDGGERRRILFTGDLGRRHMPILRDPEEPDGVNLLISESTYGDRLHEPIEGMDEQLAGVLVRTWERGGKVVVPTFALERAQEIILSLKRLRVAGRIPRVPVYVDSPLAVKITDVFKLHPDCYDAATRAMLLGRDPPFEFDGLKYVTTVDDSMAIDATEQPLVVLAGSGMCEGGRVLHHLRAIVGDPRSTVVIVGFQAQHTLGRRLVERRLRVKIFGVEHERSCEVVALNGFSAHADRDELIGFAEAIRARGALDQVALVHGEAPALKSLAHALDARGFTRIAIPAPGDRLRA
jgi:metallo-beta-lactamase family protein